MDKMSGKRASTQPPFLNFSIFDNFTEGFYAVDKNWQYIYVNKKGVALAQMSRKALIGKTPQEVFPDAHTGDFGRIAKLVMQDRKQRTIEAYYSRYGKWYELDMFPLSDGIGMLARDITKRKEIEENWRSATEQFQTLADNIPNLAWMSDSQGHIFWYNSRWYKYTGTTPIQMDTMGWEAIVAPAILQEVLAQWNVSLREGKEFEMIIPLRGKQGIYLPFLTKVVPVKDKKGKVLRWFGTSTDVTRQLQAEEDQLRLASIVTSSDDPIISKNLDGIVTSWNGAAERMFGYTAAEMIGQSIRKIIPADLQSEEDEILSKLRQGKQIEHFQTTRMAKDGRRIPILLTVSPIKNAAGKPIGASKIVHDMTVIKGTEENLAFLAAASKELSSSLDYQKTLEKIASLAVPHIADWCSVDMLDASGKVKLVALAHKDPNQVKWAVALRKNTPIDMNAPSGVPNVIRTGKSEYYPYIDDALLVANAKNKKELELLRKLQLTSIIIAPLFLERKPIGAISFITTESRKRYTKSDVSMVEDLASRASLAVENATLYRQMQKDLVQRKRLEKQKDEFIGVASHELKTPVTSIKSFAQILHYKFKKEGRTQEAALLAKLDSQINKLTDLIGDLLDVTKIEAGKMLFSESVFRFHELVAEIVEEMQRTTQRHTLHIDSESQALVFGDKDRIGQVITNLISNAIKYSPHARDIIIRSSVENGKVKLCVQDFGVGISKEKQGKVFDRFFRVSGPGRETYPGLGLGLYISSQIVKRSGGKIWVESTEGEGSTFCFTIPLKREEQRPKKNERTVA